MINPNIFAQRFHNPILSQPGGLGGPIGMPMQPYGTAMRPPEFMWNMHPQMPMQPKMQPQMPVPGNFLRYRAGAY